MNNEEYTIDYFINKFTEIPENLWFTKDYTDPNNPDKHCALGHCKVSTTDSMFNYQSAILIAIFGDFDLKVPIINDGKDERYQQSTPKQRILAALYDIKYGIYNNVVQPTYKTVLIEANVKQLIKEIHSN